MGVEGQHVVAAEAVSLAVETVAPMYAEGESQIVGRGGLAEGEEADDCGGDNESADDEKGSHGRLHMRDRLVGGGRRDGICK